MTTLADLKALFEKCETFGLKPEEIQVEFKAGGSPIALLDAKACVSVTEQGAKPTLTVNFTQKSSFVDHR